MLVENKSGAAGVTGVDFVAKAGSDAHVMGLMSASAGAIMQSLMPKMPFDPAKDIAPQILVVRVQEVFAVSAKLGIGDLKSFIAHAKANPGKITCGSAGTGGITHLAIELFKRETGTDLLHVPYRGAAPATNDLLAGTVDTVLLDISVLLPHVRSGTVKILAVTSDTRPPLLPDVPTMRELGYPQGQFRQLVRPDLARRGEPGGAQEDLRRRQCRAQDQGAGRRLCRGRRRRGRRHVGRAESLPRRGRRQMGRRHQGRQHQARVARGPAHRTRPGEDLRRAYPLAGLRRAAPSSW